MDFKTKVTNRLKSMLQAENSTVVVESMEGRDGVLSVRFHLEGAMQSPAVFNFPFAESVPLEDSLTALRDIISRNWKRAHLAPVAHRSFSTHV